MKERPIRLYPHEVRGVLSGRQTQVRRIVKWPSCWSGSFEHLRPTAADIINARKIAAGISCPFGGPGDCLWVRETFAEGFTYGGGNKVVWYRADQQARFAERIEAVCDYASVPENVRWRPSIHMPRCASRITLEITDVRVQRLQEISEEDAVAEGVFRPTGERTPIGQVVETHNGGSLIYAVRGQARECFRELWQSIHGPGSWEANPFVWVIVFRRIGL